MSDGLMFVGEEPIDQLSTVRISKIEIISALALKDMIKANQCAPSYHTRVRRAKWHTH
jgi:hypothetical protein